LPGASYLCRIFAIKEKDSLMSQALTLPAARAALISGGWELEAGSSRFNCEFADPERDPATAAALERYVDTLRASATWQSDRAEYMKILRRFYPQLGIFGLAWAPYTSGLSIPHIRQHELGSLAQSGSRPKCAMGDSSNVSAALAVAKLSPKWIGTMHGVILSGMRNAASPSQRWKWALSGSACDYEATREGRFSSADGSASGLKTYSACVHGLGHGMMIKAVEDLAPILSPDGSRDLTRELRTSLLGCAEGPRAAEACQCASGVYMQWQLDSFNSTEPREHSDGRMRQRCQRETPYAAACWLRYWSARANRAGRKISYSRDICADDTYKGKLGEQDPCAQQGPLVGSREHAACVFGWAKACFLVWAEGNGMVREQGKNTWGLQIPSVASLHPHGTPSHSGSHEDSSHRKSHDASHGASRSAILHYCAIFGSPSSLEHSLAWRACVFGSVSDIARNKAQGVQLMTRQKAASAQGEGEVQWSVLRRTCDDYFPNADPQLAKLCLMALLSHASVEHYSPCAHNVLDGERDPKRALGS
tara:strand:- start:15 stop:1619 length:1605 start_codon:yes stop_codon:yes gene_type:complete